MKIELLQKKFKFRESLPEIMNRIFAVCKTDPHFKLKTEMNQVETNITSIKRKTGKQSQLLEQSSKLTQDVGRRIALIKGENESRQTELLESLGSEL
jgi:hypothetical protein